MHTLFRLVVVFLFITMTTMYSKAQQTQMKNWMVKPYRIETPVSPSSAPTTSSYSSMPINTSALNVSNSIYDNDNSNNNNGNILFYIANDQVYDYNNELLGTLRSNGSEIAIVPFESNASDPCQKKFNIFTTAGGFTSQTGLFRTVLDMNSYTLTAPAEIDAVPFGNEFGAIAVGLPDPVSHDRYLYWLAGSGTVGSSDGQIRRISIFSNGDVSSFTPVYPNPPIISNSNAGAEVFTRELDLSPDGKWLAWGSFEGTINGTQSRYHLIELNNIGLYSNYYQFNIPNITGNIAQGFRGIEFFQDGSTNRLFLGAGLSGIYFTEMPTCTNFYQVGLSDGISANSTYGLSQIELFYTGQMYAASGNMNNNYGAFEPTSFSPTLYFSPGNKNFHLNGTPTYPLPPKVTFTNDFYTLPDQIDGQDYSLITPSPLTQVLTVNSLTFPSTPAPNQTATWTYGTVANPLGATSDVHIINEIRVVQNSHLTISGMTFKFSENAKVIIEPGSTLTLQDGTVLTSNYIEDPCIVPYTWQGVEVWGGAGNPSQIGNPLAVGKLVMNDATIEYAKCGVRAQRYFSNNQPFYRGGIITANPGAKFINCNVGVEYLPYQNKINNKEYRNQSTFNGVGFQCDKKYPFTTPPICTLIDGCFGIQFESCNFEIVNSPTLFPYPGYGIKALNSNFIVSNGTLFSDLFHAIDVRRTSGTNTFTVLNSVFKNNQKGIYARNINNPDVRVNTFELGNYSNGGLISQFGVFTIYCSGFKLEENQFDLSIPNNSSVRKYGIYTNSCGPAPNEIYMNYFNNINYGNYAVGVNRDPAAPKTSGLEYICNINTGNVNFDFLIADGTVNGKGGIRLNQGSSSTSAGNTFSVLSPNGSFSDFNNLTSMNVSYYYDLNKIPHNFKGITPTTTFTITPNTCPSHICDPPCNDLLTNLQIQQLAADYDAAETAYLNLLYSYNQLMDGGNTNALLTQIQTTWSNDAVALRDELLEMSPYVSSDVLREAASREILPSAMLLMICLANPDATKDEDLLSYLQFEIANPLTQYMIDLIRLSWDEETSRTVMESMLADYNSVMARSSGRLLSDLFSRRIADYDTLNINDTTDYNQQINDWLDRIQTLTAKYDLVENHLAADEFEEAEEVLGAIPDNFSLSEDQQIEYGEYVYFYNFRKDLRLNNQDLSMLTNEQMEELLSFVEGEPGFAKGLAQNALCFYNSICNDDEYPTEGEGGRMMYHGHVPSSIKTNEKTDPFDMEVNVTPNPVKEMATFRYRLPEGTEHYSLSVCDITGKEINRFDLSSGYGKLDWNTSSLNSGLYYYTVSKGNLRIAEGKISVRK